jgi:uroporphyrinogen-III decarboxylase
VLRVAPIPEMEIGGLKRDFGDRLCLWGGVSLECLIQGTPEETRKVARHAMEVGVPGGGFILGPSHSIAKGTKYDNFMAMLDEFARLRDRL